MRQVFPDLWQTSTQHPLRGYPHTACNVYLLLWRSGNVRFYSTGREAIGRVNDGADHDRIEEFGGIGHILLAHWHEASPSIRTIMNRFGASLICHARDAPPIEKEAGIAPDMTFWERQIVLGDIEAISTPGHTVGSACYLHHSPHGHMYLFSGDTIWPARGSWTTVPSKTMPGSHRTDRASTACDA